jgi:hypothetical protein
MPHIAPPGPDGVSEAIGLRPARRGVDDGVPGRRIRHTPTRASRPCDRPGSRPVRLPAAGPLGVIRTPVTSWIADIGRAARSRNRLRGQAGLQSVGPRTRRAGRPVADGTKAARPTPYPPRQRTGWRAPPRSARESETYPSALSGEDRGRAGVRAYGPSPRPAGTRDGRQSPFPG